MKRVLLCVAYDGTGYCGWQYQEGLATIEGELNKALSELLNSPTEVIGASRTDAGVHGLCNMAVFDTTARIPAEKVSYALNTRLPDDIRVVWSKEVDANFHPRHRLTEKTYEYHIWNADYMPPTKRLYAYKYNRKLNIDLMNEGASYLVGEHDFKSFCSVHSQAETTVRNVTGIKVLRDGDEVTIKVSGNGFLYNMVRIIAGTLIEVGYGHRTPENINDVLAACNREAAGPTAPANGLVLADFKFLE